MRDAVRSFAEDRSGGPQLEHLVGVGRVLGRRVLDRVPGRRTAAVPTVEGRSAEAGPLPSVLRLSPGAAARTLQVDDGRAWCEAMIANERRMKEWWDPTADWTDRSGADAFYEHFYTWSRLNAKRLGRSIALVDDKGLAGELQLYEKDPGLAELGFWCAPNRFGARDLVALLGWQIDALMVAEGHERLDAPVAAGNRYPKRVLAMLGFEHEGTLRNWRRLGESRVDMDMYGLTLSDWLQVRFTLQERAPWPLVS